MKEKKFKFNIIDLLIVLVIIAAVVFVGMRFLGGNDNDLGETHKVRMTFYANDAPAFLADRVSIGEAVTDFDKSSSLGTVTVYETEEAYTYAASDGKAVKLPIPDTCLLTLCCETVGDVAPDGLRVNGVLYCIGGTHTISAGQIRFACRLADFEVID